MSAIFGRYNFDGRPVTSAALLPMQEAMAYWGPDGDGIWCDGPVGLGHLHRDNTPESIGDALPWVCPASGDVITASVRLDNRDELFNALSIPHPDRAGMPDSRIILKAYQQWGEACADRLIGDWVFVIWNARERKLFIARDHYGNTGLFYYRNSRFLVFASSLKGLLALPEVPQQPNPVPIAKVLVAWPADRALTCYEDIFRLTPAHSMTVFPERVEVNRYWYLEHTPDLHLNSDEEYVEAFLEVFAEAVRCRLRCSAPVGVTLSGGLDSGSVAALAANELGKQDRRLTAYSSVPIADTDGLVGGGHFGDETPFIEATAKFTGNIDLNYIDARAISPVAAIERSLFIHDQPANAAGNLYWITALMAEAQKQGLGAMLTGQGGNATISWRGAPEPSLVDNLVKLQWGTFGRKLRSWREITGGSLWGSLRSQIVRPTLTHGRRLMKRLNDQKDVWREYSAINLAFARELDLNRRMRREGHDPTFSRPQDMEVRLEFMAPGRSVGDFWFEIGGAYGLEVRDPTFDPRVMSFCWSIPQSQYVRDGQNKLLIRRAMTVYLPTNVLWNRRKGCQAADIGQRILNYRTEVGTTLARLEGSKLACHYLDLPRMRSVFESVQHGIDSANSMQCNLILLRGLMAGLFLMRFDT